MKKSFRVIFEKTDLKDVECFAKSIKPEKVPAETVSRIRQTVIGAKSAEKREFRWMPVIAAAAVVALAVAAVPVVNGILKNSPAVVPILDTSSTPAPVSSDASPVDSTPSEDDPVSAIIPPVSSDTQLVIDPVSDVTTEPVSSEAPPVSSVHDPVSAIIPPVSSDTPSKNDPVSSDPPVSSTPDPISSDSPVSSTVSVSDPIIIEQPSYSQNYNFNTYSALKNALRNENSQLYNDYDESLGETYKDFLDSFSKGGEELKVPMIFGSRAVLKGKTDMQKIALFSSELYNLPWIWYYCDYNGSCVVVCMAPLGHLREYGLNTSGDIDYLIDMIAPNSPRPQNKDDFAESIDDIALETLQLESGEVDAYVIKYKEWRTHYRFVYEDCLFCVWDYSGEELDSDFWNAFSVEAF